MPRGRIAIFDGSPNDQRIGQKVLVLSIYKDTISGALPHLPSVQQAEQTDTVRLF